MLAGVLALQGDFAEHLAVLEECGADGVAVRTAGGLEQVDALVIPGGESTTMLKLIDRFELRDLLRKRINDGLPVFGTCAGAIVLARASADGYAGSSLDRAVSRKRLSENPPSDVGGTPPTGGSERVRQQAATPPNPPLGVLDLSVVRNAYGRQVDSFETELEIAGVGPVHAIFIRAPVFEDAGPGVEVLAEWGGRAVLVRAGNILASAFHPELAGDLRLHRYFLEHVAGGG
ncbi:MAG: pyridoxal 5'-phosphate synthase glutaminase subunit PdxT [Actinomycetota bacterium]